jgi:hypothetical protein
LIRKPDVPEKRLPVFAGATNSPAPTRNSDALRSWVQFRRLSFPLFRLEEDQMPNNGKPDVAIDMATFIRNRREIPQSVLAEYEGQWIAISGDGTRVLASGPDLETAEANLAAIGIPGNSVGWERIPAEDEWF